FSLSIQSLNFCVRSHAGSYATHPDAYATAHSDTSIMTCLYYQDSGLQLKVNGCWIEAPVLKSDEMLITFGVPGEIISNGSLKAVRDRVKCDERYVVVYFHNTSAN